MAHLLDCAGENDLLDSNELSAVEVEPHVDVAEAAAADQLSHGPVLDRLEVGVTAAVATAE